MHHRLHVEIEREEDGRWIADVPALPGCMVYGDTAHEAVTKAKVLALSVLAERAESGDSAEGIRENLEFVDGLEDALRR